MDKTYFKFYLEWRDYLSELDDAEYRMMVETIIEYTLTQGDVNFEDRGMRMAWKAIKGTIDRTLSQADRSEIARQNGKKGGAPAGNQNAKKKQPETTQNNQKQPKTTKTNYTNTYTNTNTITNTNTNPTIEFVPPTKEDVEVYCMSKGLLVNAEEFVDFYSSKGWMVGPNPMRDWRAAARNWSRKRQEAPREVSLAEEVSNWI